MLTIKVFPSSCSGLVIKSFSLETTPRAHFIYGRAKSTFSARAGVTVKFARTMSTFPVSRTSTREAASTGTYFTFTPKSFARRSAK